MMTLTVRDVMTRELVTIDSATPCDTARRLMIDRRIRHLPVVDAGRLVGMLSDRDVRAADGRGRLVAREIMTAPALTVTSATAVERAARRMLDAGVGALAVVDGGTLAGIVTHVDLLHAFAQVIETEAEERIAVACPSVR
jgi:acetoin utilization protein AcuB